MQSHVPVLAIAFYHGINQCVPAVSNRTNLVFVIEELLWLIVLSQNLKNMRATSGKLAMSNAIAKIAPSRGHTKEYVPRLNWSTSESQDEIMLPPLSTSERIISRCALEKLHYSTG